MYLTAAEWDNNRLDNEWLAERMKKVCPDKLLGYFVLPGVSHGEIPHDEMSKIFSHYLGTKRTETDNDESYVAAKKKFKE